MDKSQQLALGAWLLEDGLSDEEVERLAGVTLLEIIELRVNAAWAPVPGTPDTYFAMARDPHAVPRPRSPLELGSPTLEASAAVTSALPAGRPRVLRPRPEHGVPRHIFRSRVSRNLNQEGATVMVMSPPTLGARLASAQA